jgi:hypothetical protein
MRQPRVRGQLPSVLRRLGARWSLGPFGLRVACCVVGLLAGHGPAQELPTSAPAVEFRSVEVFLDPGGKSLAAYQLQLVAETGTVKITGIEGGEHPAFQAPPFYDPKAMQQERVILAAFSTAAADKLPKNKTRVATVHFQFTGRGSAQFAVKLQSAATVNGDKIPAEATVAERKSP